MKNIVLDTNVLMSDPNCILTGFEENDLIIPLIVIEELDNNKTESSQRGYYARESLRNIESLKNGDGRHVNEGLKRNELGGLLKVVCLTKREMDHYNEPHGLNTLIKDNIIILTAMKVKAENPENETVIVSNDTALRIKSSLLNIGAEFYKDSRIKKEFLEYQGYRNLELPLEFFGEFIDDRWVSKELPITIPLDEIDIGDVIQNEFLLLYPATSCELRKKEIKKLKAVYRVEGNELLRRDLHFRGLYGDISGKNLEQSVAISALMEEKIKIVTLTGPAGSGKTILSEAVCLTKMFKGEKKYDKIILLKPNIQVSKDIGFLPGSVQEKIAPYLNSFLDNFECLRKKEMEHTKTSKPDTFDDLVKQGYIELECISFIRGRSLSDSLIILDEAQNIDRHVMKTVISRVGENSKIIILGDLSQIDTPFLNAENNGLSHLMKKFRGQEIYAHVSFIRGVRSEIAELAATLL